MGVYHHVFNTELFVTRNCEERSNVQQQTMKPGFIYIITNKNNSTLYIGVTSNLPHRIIDHIEKRYQNSFSARYNLNKLVYYEQYQMIGDAIGREKQSKGGSRKTKIDLIEKFNPEWNNLLSEVQDLMTV